MVYPLVLTVCYGISPFLLDKSSTNGSLSIATLNNQRVTNQKSGSTLAFCSITLIAYNMFQSVNGNFSEPL